MQELREVGGTRGRARIHDLLTLATLEGKHGPTATFVINRVNGRVLKLGPTALALIELLFFANPSVAEMSDCAPDLFDRLAHSN